MPPKAKRPEATQSEAKRPKTQSKVTKAVTTDAGTTENANAVSDHYLLIVESPSKCKKIEDYLGEKYRCISSKGHFREIDGLKSIRAVCSAKTKNASPEIQFTPIENKRDHIDTIRPIIRAYPPQNILLATDDDREGEAIAWHICQEFGLPVETTPRIVFHEITKPALLAAVANPTTINMSLVYAQQARQVLDILVGFKVSPLLWKYVCNNKQNALSAGRCQTPALRLVYDNDREYKDHMENVAIEYRIVGNFTAMNADFVLSRNLATESEVADFMERSKLHTHKLTLGEKRPSVTSPPRPLNTSRLLQLASSELGMSPKTTMELCQILYQSGLITYMRTDSQQYSAVFLEKCREHILANFANNGKYPAEKYLGDFSKLEMPANGTNPHEAIRATNLKLPRFQHDNTNLVRLYTFIWRTTIESCMSAAEYIVVPATITSPLPGTEYTHNIRTLVFEGWMANPSPSAVPPSGVIQSEEPSSENQGLAFYLASMKTPVVKYNFIKSSATLKDRKFSHYTEASLIQTLEKIGIGRPSTFSMLVETIQDRGYVRKLDIAGVPIEYTEHILQKDGIISATAKTKVFGEEHGKLVIQPTGIIVAEFLTEHFAELFSYGYTSNMETALDEIAQTAKETAAEQWPTICRNCYKEIKELAKPIAKMERKAFPLQTPGYDLIFHSFGASIRHTLEDGTHEYKRAVLNGTTLDIDRAKRGEYTLEDVLETSNAGILGQYCDHPITMKIGKFGAYFDWNGETFSAKSLKKHPRDITINDAIAIIEKKYHATIGATIAGENGMPMNITSIPDTYQQQADKEKQKPPGEANILMHLSREMSIRKGKFGPYIFYKTAKMKNPEFYALKGFQHDWKTCDKSEIIEWLKTKYKLNV